MLRAPTNSIDYAADRLPWIPGSRALDAEFREWAESTLAEWERWAGRELVPSWRFLGHLYNHFGGPLLEGERAPIWRYRLRWLAVAFVRDRAGFDAEARRYLLGRFHAHPQT